jgi:hypothetical protein
VPRSDFDEPRLRLLLHRALAHRLRIRAHRREAHGDNGLRDESAVRRARARRASPGKATMRSTAMRPMPTSRPTSPKRKLSNWDCSAPKPTASANSPGHCGCERGTRHARSSRCCGQKPSPAKLPNRDYASFVCGSAQQHALRMRARVVRLRRQAADREQAALDRPARVGRKPLRQVFEVLVAEDGFEPPTRGL